VILIASAQLFAANHVYRKDKPINQVFGQVFSWGEALDAAADIYNGVS
jgi:hypothetical protein